MPKLIYLIGVFIALTTELFAQICDKNLVPTKDENLRYKHRNNRCEGFYTSDITTYSINLVNLTCGSLTYKLDTSEVIKITPLFDNKTQVHIQASALQLGKYYRMDGHISSEQTFSWPVKDVLKPADLKDYKIGICGWVENTNSKMPVAIPLKVNTNTSKSSSCNELYLIFTANIDLDFIAYGMNKVSNAKDVELHKLPKKIYYAGTPIKLHVDYPSTGDLHMFYISGRIYNETLDTKEEKGAESINLYFIIDLPN